jgi:hypothetical protein
MSLRACAPEWCVIQTSASSNVMASMSGVESESALAMELIFRRCFTVTAPKPSHACTTTTPALSHDNGESARAKHAGTQARSEFARRAVHVCITCVPSSVDAHWHDQKRRGKDEPAGEDMRLRTCVFAGQCCASGRSLSASSSARRRSSSAGLLWQPGQVHGEAIGGGSGRRRISLLSFPYVCPEPVLVK